MGNSGSSPPPPCPPNAPALIARAAQPPNSKRIKTTKILVKNIARNNANDGDWGNFNLPNFTDIPILDTNGLRGITNLQTVIDKFGSFSKVASCDLNVSGTGFGHDCYMYFFLNLINTGPNGNQRVHVSQRGPSDAENFNKTLNMYTGPISTIPTSYRFNTTCDNCGGGGCGCTKYDYTNVNVFLEITIDINVAEFCLQYANDTNCLTTGYTGPNYLDISTELIDVQNYGTQSTVDGDWGNFTLPELSRFLLNDPQGTGRVISLQNVVDLVGENNIFINSILFDIKGNYTGHDCSLYMFLNFINSFTNNNVFTSTSRDNIAESFNSVTNMYSGKVNELPISYKFNNSCTGTGCGCNRGTYNNIIVKAKITLRIKLFEYCTTNKLSQRLCGGTGPAQNFPSPSPSTSPTPSPSPGTSPSPSPGTSPSPSPSRTPSPTVTPTPSPSNFIEQNKPLVIGLSVGGGLLLLILIVVILYFALRSKPKTATVSK
jgi:hypothetical protein